MTKTFKIGCTNNFAQAHETLSPLERFAAVRDSGAFDYMHGTPSSEELGDYVAASERTGIPMLTGNMMYALGAGRGPIDETFHNASRAGIELLNVMLATRHVDGHDVSNAEVTEAFCEFAEAGDTAGVAVSFEVHVDCWSERYKNVEPVVRSVLSRGRRFRLTIDYSHVIFKIENPRQQEISDVRADVEEGLIVLDPFEPGNLYERWLALNVVDFAQFRPVVPNNPPNLWGTNPDGSLPRGILYPMTRPRPGEWHSPWHAYKLEACKEGLRTAMRYHLTHDESPLKYVITEMIPQPDYAMNARFSLIEQNAACARWIRNQWNQFAAMHAAGIPLAVSP